MGDAGFTTYLVDDDPAVLRSITRLLKAGGYKTKSFSSPQKFLSSHDPSVPGCAIIDLVMSELDGLRLQEALARSGSQRPIIFLTGRGDVPTSGMRSFLPSFMRPSWMPPRARSGRKANRSMSGSPPSPTGSVRCWSM